MGRPPPRTHLVPGAGRAEGEGTVVGEMRKRGWSFSLTIIEDEFEACFSSSDGRFLINEDIERYGRSINPAAAISEAAYRALKEG